MISGKNIEKKMKEIGKFSQELLKQAINYIQISVEETKYFFTQISFSIDEYHRVYYEQNFLESKEKNWPVNSYVSQFLEYQFEPSSNYNGINLAK